MNEYLKEGRMEEHTFTPPILNPVSRKRPSLDISNMTSSSSSSAYTKTVAPSPLHQSTTNNDHTQSSQHYSPQETAKYTNGMYQHSPQQQNNSYHRNESQYQSIEEDDELRILGSALEKFRSRLLQLSNKNSMYEQDLNFCRSEVSRLEVERDNEKHSVSRANNTVIELQSLVSRVIDRLSAVEQAKKSIDEKASKVQELVGSLNGFKIKISEKNQNLENERDSVRQELDLAKKEVARLEESIQQINSEMKNVKIVYDNDRSKTNQEISELDGQCKLLLLDKQNLQNSLSEINLEFTRERSTNESIFDAYKNGLVDIISELSAKLTGREPASFGDKSIEAIGVVVKELYQEHLMNDGNKFQEFQEIIDNQNNNEISWKNENDQIRSNLSSLKNEKVQLEKECATQKSAMQRLERRIAEQQAQSGVSASKLADLQKHSVMASLLRECVFENQASEMDYEDMKNFLLERLDHRTCDLKVREGNDLLKAKTVEFNNLKSSFEEFRKQSKEKETEFLAKINNLSNELQSMKECASQVSQKRIAKGDKTIDNLIELIERDTQEIKNTGKQVAAPVPQEKKTRSRHNLGKYRKRSPVSNQSEMDLWSVFKRS